MEHFCQTEETYTHTCREREREGEGGREGGRERGERERNIESRLLVFSLKEFKKGW